MRHADNPLQNYKIGTSMGISEDDMSAGLMTVAEAWKFCRMSKRSFERAVHEGEVESIRPNGPRGRRYFTRRQLVDFLNTRVVAAERQTTRRVRTTARKSA